MHPKSVLCGLCAHVTYTISFCVLWVSRSSSEKPDSNPLSFPLISRNHFVDSRMSFPFSKGKQKPKTLNKTLNPLPSNQTSLQRRSLSFVSDHSPLLSTLTLKTLKMPSSPTIQRRSKHSKDLFLKFVLEVHIRRAKSSHP